MKNFIVALCAFGLLATPALAQSVGEKTGINSVAGIAPKTEDFVKIAAISDMFEIQSSQLAQTKSQDAGIKAFAEKMVTDHTKTSEELKGLVSGGKVKAEIPAAMDDSHKSKLEKLKSLNGKDFDEQYADDQRAAHKEVAHPRLVIDDQNRSLSQPWPEFRVIWRFTNLARCFAPHAPPSRPAQALVRPFAPSHSAFDFYRW
jgi:putative membrane protein